MKFRRYCVQTSLTSAFKKLGLSVGKHPVPYCSLPLVVSALLCIGFYWIHMFKDVEYLFTPLNGRALREREAVESLFPPSNYSLDLMSITRLQQTIAVLLIPKDNLSVLRENIFYDALQIDKAIYNTKVPWKNKILNYKDVCVKSYTGECSTNDVLSLKGKMASLRRNTLRIKFPLNVNAVTQHISFYGIGLGGVTLDDSSHVVNALAMRLVYLLEKTTIEKKQMSEKWEESFFDVVFNLTSYSVNIFIGSGTSMDNEVSRVTEQTQPLFKFAVLLMGSFTVISSMTSNCITSKPWVAVAACLSPCLGVVSAFGLLLMSGIQYIDLNIVVFFLLLGIGLDDSFIMLAAWRRTDPKLRVEERLSEAYSKAAVSITITSLTNCLSLCVGIGSPFPVIRLFCIYTVASIILAYIYQITFFGSVLALSGIREHKGLHSVLCFSIKEKKVTNSSVLNLVCFGCSKKENGMQETPSVLSKLAKSFYANMLKTGGKVVIMVVFLIYLSTSLYSLTYAKEDFDIRKSLQSESYLLKYWNWHYKYFEEYGDPIHIVINETLDYSSKYVQEDIEKILCSVAEIPNVNDKELSYSWLNYFLQSVNDKKFYFAYYGYNISESNDFIAALRDVFLRFPSAGIFRQHIKFNEDKTKIISSRFIALSKDVTSSTPAKRLLTSLWKISDSTPYTVYVYNYWFPMYNLYTEIVGSFKTTLLSAIGLITMVFFVIIPNFFCTCSILFITVSIQIGVIGYMSVWGVPINPISMVCVMTSVGLSVDYAAHVSYAYLSSKEDDPNQKTISALRSTAYPVIQGCLSTLIGAVVFVFAPLHSMLVFFKVITLVMLISLFHGIFVIPFVLNSFETLWSTILRRNKADKETGKRSFK